VADDGDPAEIIKAGAEGAASGAITALIAPVAGFLGKLFGPSTEQLGGWAGDVIGYQRWKTRVRILQKSEQLLLDAGVEAHEVPRSVLMPLLEAAGDEEDDAMADRFAALLANAASDSVRRSFPGILADLEPQDARILDHVFDGLAQIAPELHPQVAVLKVAIASLLDIPEPEVAVSVDNLMRNRLVRPSSLTLGDPSDSDGVRLTEFGIAFVRACRPPATRYPSIKYTDAEALRRETEANRAKWADGASPSAESSTPTDRVVPS
jgi:hypothetical protein